MKGLNWSDKSNAFCSQKMYTVNMVVFCLKIGSIEFFQYMQFHTALWIWPLTQIVSDSFMWWPLISPLKRLLKLPSGLLDTRAALRSWSQHSFKPLSDKLDFQPFDWSKKKALKNLISWLKNRLTAGFQLKACQHCSAICHEEIEAQIES